MWLATLLAEDDRLTDQDLNALARHEHGGQQVLEAVLEARRMRNLLDLDPVDLLPVVVTPQQLEPLGADDAVVQFLSDDVVLVIGNTALADSLGNRLQTLNPALTDRLLAELGPMLNGAGAGAQTVSAVSALREGAVLLKVAKESLPALQKYGAVMSDGKMLGVLRADGSRGFTHMLRFETAGGANLLRTAGAMSGLVFTASVVAGQLHMQRTLQSICLAVDDLKARDREEQVAGVTVAQRKVMGVLQTALEVGELTPALMAQLPDIQRLEEQVERAGLELDRHRRTLSKLPSKASDRLNVLQQTVDDLLLALGLYREAERSLSVTLALAHHQAAEVGDRAAEALQRLEQRQRQQRLDSMTGLARELEKIMDGLEVDPGSAWFRQGRKEKVRLIARQVGSDLAALADLQPLADASVERPQITG